MTSIYFVLLGVGIIAFMAARDHAKNRAMRWDLLDQCATLLERSAINHGNDGFPSLEGRHAGRYVRADLIPDTITIRRLPQLWLSLSQIEPLPGRPEFAMLVRPTGTEFYSLTVGYEHRLEPPPGLPDEILIRGNRASAQRFLDRVGPVLARIVSDPKVKEVGVTERGLRLVWQASEGRRGEHLILRQSVFDEARVMRSDFARLLADIDELSRALAGGVKVSAT